MQAMIRHVNSLFKPKEAEELAEKLNADEEDGWKYVVKHGPNPTSFSVIEVYDETGAFVNKI